jgi:hypothetical protein
MNLGNGYTVMSIPAIELDERQKGVWSEWIAALRSGNFTQGRRLLKTEKELPDKNKILMHCCLGVLCDVLGPDRQKELGVGIFAPDYANVTTGYKAWMFEGLDPDALTKAYKVSLPQQIVNSLRLETSSGIEIGIIWGMSKEESCMTLAGLNDDGVRFDEIANILEKAMSGGYKLQKEAKNETH